RSQPAEEAKALVERAVSADAGQTGLASDGDLSDHQREAEGDGQNDIDQKEGTAAVLCGEVRETPQVSETNGRASRGKDKADAAGKAAAFFFHLQTPIQKNSIDR